MREWSVSAGQVMTIADYHSSKSLWKRVMGVSVDDGVSEKVRDANMTCSVTKFWVPCSRR